MTGQNLPLCWRMPTLSGQIYFIDRCPRWACNKLAVSWKHGGTTEYTSWQIDACLKCLYAFATISWKVTKWRKGAISFKSWTTLEVHTAVDITPFLVASWSQCPDKGVIVLHRAPALLWDKSQFIITVLIWSSRPSSCHHLTFNIQKVYERTLKSPIQSLLAQVCWELMV